MKEIEVVAYLEKIAQPYHFRLRISDHLANYDDRIALDRLGGQRFRNEERFLRVPENLGNLVISYSTALPSKSNHEVTMLRLTVYLGTRSRHWLIHQQRTDLGS